MKLYKLERKQKLAITIDEAWNYFSNPKNLQEITPDKLSFEITSKLPEKMYQGMIISYNIKPFPFIKMNWITEITAVQDQKMFVDEQRFGPYKFWHHQHIFEKIGNDVLMTDIVHYALPFGLIGKIAHKLFIYKQLQDIFSFRFQYLEKKFNINKNILI